MTRNWHEPACPSCKGKGRRVLTGKGSTWIELSCDDCYGTGTAGAQAPTPRHPDPDAPRTPVSEHPAVLEAPLLCPRCLGARVVVSAPQFRSQPCPDCSA